MIDDSAVWWLPSQKMKVFTAWLRRPSKGGGPVSIGKVEYFDGEWEVTLIFSKVMFHVSGKDDKVFEELDKAKAFLESEWPVLAAEQMLLESKS